MAEVFAGYAIGDHGFQKPVAIKRLLPELSNDHVFVERLIQEAKLLVGMTHGNVVSVIDLAREGDDVFLVMEYVDGPSLRQLLKARGQRGLSLGVATYIVQAAAAGLEFAHARPGGAIIHADISPSNLLLTTSGEVRVADFGIARREGGGHGIVEGKWAYMAPEQARGEPLTARADVFALGVVLYELICGAHPFGRQVTADDREDLGPMRVIPPRIVRPTIPAGLDEICMRALAHDPRQRYARMQQLIDALVEERFGNGWRESASDLASAIREVGPGATPQQQAPRTMVTDRPLTIVTRSLLSQPRRFSQSSLPENSQQNVTNDAASQSASASSSVSVDASLMMPQPAPAMPMLEIPPLVRADGTPMPPFRLSQAVMPNNDLAGVIGGTTITGTGHQAEVVEAKSHRWTFLVLGIATLLGSVAAVAIQLAPGSDKDGGNSQAQQQQVAQAAPEKKEPKADPPPQNPDDEIKQDVPALPELRKDDPKKDDRKSDTADESGKFPEGAPAKEPIQKPNDNTGDKDQPKAESDSKTGKPDSKTDKVDNKPDAKTDKVDAKTDKVDRPRPVRQPAAKKNNADCQPQGSVNPFDKRPPCEMDSSGHTAASTTKTSKKKDVASKDDLIALKVTSVFASAPAWATAEIEGYGSCDTPCTLHVPPGTYMVRFRNNEQHLRGKQRVTLSADENVKKLQVQLEEE
jgi:serine/threonine protein kinase